MARIVAVLDEKASGKVGEMFAGIKKKLGMVPNMMRTMAHSPALLEGYLNFSGALSGGALPAKLRERIALLSAEENSCEYCLAAHATIGKMSGLAEGEVEAARRGDGEGRDGEVLRFASEVLKTKGGVSDAALARARAAGLSDEELAEVVGHVALNVLTNYFNRMADTKVDFPAVTPLVLR